MHEPVPLSRKLLDVLREEKAKEAICGTPASWPRISFGRIWIIFGSSMRDKERPKNLERGDFYDGTTYCRGNRM